MIGWVACVLAQVAAPQSAPEQPARPPATAPSARPAPTPWSVPALQAGLGNVRGLALDSRGRIYVTSEDLGLIFRAEPAGSLTIVAGRVRRPRERGRDDRTVPTDEVGPAASAFLKAPAGLALDGQQRLLVADRLTRRIRRIDLASGLIETLAGTDGEGSDGDGGPRQARFVQPTALAVDEAGNVYVSDTGDHRVRRIDAASGTISTVAGDGFPGHFGDGGAARGARLSSPEGLALAGRAALIVADRGNHRVRRIDLHTGRITTLAGSGRAGDAGDSGPATAAQLRDPSGVAVAADGAVFIADRGNHRLRRIGVAGTITTIAGSGDAGPVRDGGPARDGRLSLPTAVAVGADGSVYVADTGHRRLRRIDPRGTIATAAGDGGLGFCGDGKVGPKARFAWVSGVAVDAAGNAFVADLEHNRVRRIDAATGIVTTVAGDGRAGYDGDGGPATSAALAGPYGLAIDGSGQLYIADSDNHRIRRVRADGVIETVGGTGIRGFSGDGGPATRAQLDDPHGLAIDPAGRLLIADWRNQRLRRIDLATGTIDTIAGSGGAVTGDDGVPARQAGLDRVTAVAVDRDGSVYFSEIRKPRVRRLDARTGLLQVVAGSGVRGVFSVSGPARRLGFESPDALALDGAGALLVADGAYIWRIDLGSGHMEVWAGRDGRSASSPAAPALRLSIRPHGLAFDPGGGLLVTEDYGVRRIAPGAKAVVPLAGGGEGF